MPKGEGEGCEGGTGSAREKEKERSRFASRFSLLLCSIFVTNTLLNRRTSSYGKRIISLLIPNLSLRFDWR